MRRHRAFVITSGRRVKNASDAAGRGWGALPTGHEGPGLDGFSWCPLVTLWGDMVNAESHVQGRCDCLPSPPGIYALYSMRYILPVSPACAVDTATTSCVAPINGLDEPRKIAQRVASGDGALFSGVLRSGTQWPFGSTSYRLDAAPICGDQPRRRKSLGRFLTSFGGLAPRLESAYL